VPDAVAVATELVDVATLLLQASDLWRDAPLPLPVELTTVGRRGPAPVYVDLAGDPAEASAQRIAGPEEASALVARALAPWLEDALAGGELDAPAVLDALWRGSPVTPGPARSVREVVAGLLLGS